MNNNNELELDMKVPSREDDIYKKMLQYQEYEFTYCIAYEMLLRNDDFYEQNCYAPQSDHDIEQRRLLLLEKFGVDDEYFYDYFDTMGTDVSKINDNLLLGNFFNDFKIGNIKDGLFKLIEYYYKANQIYQPIPGHENHEIKNRIIKDKSVAEIYIKYDQYYIPIECENKKTIVQLSTELSMGLLNKSFRKTIQYSDYLVPYIQTEPIFKAPTLKFNSAQVINLPVNLNLPENELVAYIRKVKEEYDNLYYSPKRPNESIYKAIDRLERPKSEKKIPKIFKNYKAFIIDAFFIYDLYSALQPHYEEKIKKLKSERDKEIKKISEDKTIPDLRDIIKDIKESYKYKISEWNTDSLKDYILKKTNFSKDKVQESLTLMNSYIDNMRYKVLITGAIEK